MSPNLGADSPGFLLVRGQDGSAFDLLVSTWVARLRRASALRSARANMWLRSSLAARTCRSASGSVWSLSTRFSNLRMNPA